MKKILVVGAGFAGSVLARELADSGNYMIDVIDKRPHIAGNCYDPIHESGVRIHQYGPHIFHTNSEEVFSWLSRFTGWIEYRHKVQAYVPPHGCIPFPLNRESIRRLYKLGDGDFDMRQFLESRAVMRDRPSSARDVIEGVYGRELGELFFERYTQKMWGISLDELPASVMRRLPVRYDDSDGYFNDKYQCMPSDGYVSMFNRILDHVGISVSLNTGFTHDMLKSYDHSFLSLPIDTFFDSCYGDLPYRSIKFDAGFGDLLDGQTVPTVNFTDLSVYSRLTRWELYPQDQGGSSSLITKEIPCDYRDNNMERYYPVKTVDGAPQELYRKYSDLAAARQDLTFIGRCGKYQYLDMHQVVAQSLMVASEFMSKA